MVHERYRGQWDAVIGEELECQHEHGDAATLKIFHVFNFGTSENFLKIYSWDATFSFGLFHSNK